jgi:hypothetical protein
MPTTLSKTRAAICDSLIETWDNILNPIEAVETQYRIFTSEFATQLATVVDWIDPVTALNDLFYDTNMSLPGSTLTDIQELLNIVNECIFFENQSPLTSIYTAQNGVFNIIDASVNNLSGLYRQFGPGKYASLINSLLRGLGIPGGQSIANLLKKADNLLSCLTWQCTGFYDPRHIVTVDYAQYVSDFSTRINDLYADLNVEDNPFSPNYGEFKYDVIYDQIGLGSQERTWMNQTTKGIDDAKQMVLNGISSSTSAFKQAKRLGEIIA